MRAIFVHVPIALGDALGDRPRRTRPDRARVNPRYRHDPTRRRRDEHLVRRAERVRRHER